MDSLTPDRRRTAIVTPGVCPSLTAGTPVRGRHMATARSPGCRTFPASPRVLASERGLSLVEVTIMLVILLVLAGMLVPVMDDSIKNARVVTAQNNLSQIAVALVNFQRDVGPLVFDGGRVQQIQTATSSLRPVIVLASEGEIPLITDRVPVETANPLLVSPSLALDASSVEPWVSSPNTDLLDLHLRVNGRGYPETRSGPGAGWNGPYLTMSITSDPWGRQYLVNTGFLNGLPPTDRQCARCAVFVISAGPNGILETPFRQPIANAQVFSDDLYMRIQ